MIDAESMTLYDAVELAHQQGFPCDPNVMDARFFDALGWLEWQDKQYEGGRQNGLAGVGGKRLRRCNN